MTREEAKKYIKSKMCNKCSVYLGGGKCSDNCKVIEAIKALEQEPCEDCISREQAIKQCGFGMTSLLIADNLRKLPSVTPQSCEDVISRQATVEREGKK